MFDATGGQIMLAGDEKWYWRVLNTGPAWRTRRRRAPTSPPRSRSAARRSRRSCCRSPTGRRSSPSSTRSTWRGATSTTTARCSTARVPIEARQILTTVDDRAGGERRITNTPYRFSAAEAGVRGPAPYRGEHNYEAIADWLGDDCPDLDGLHASGVLLQDDHARQLTEDR